MKAAHLGAALIGIVAAASVWWLWQRTSCASRLARIPAGVWSTSDRWGPPAWAIDARVIHCRDGRVWTWRGDPPGITAEDSLDLPSLLWSDIDTAAEP